MAASHHMPAAPLAGLARAAMPTSSPICLCLSPVGSVIPRHRYAVYGSAPECRLREMRRCTCRENVCANRRTQQHAAITARDDADTGDMLPCLPRRRCHYSWRRYRAVFIMFAEPRSSLGSAAMSFAATDIRQRHERRHAGAPAPSFVAYRYARLRAPRCLSPPRRMVLSPSYHPLSGECWVVVELSVSRNRGQVIAAYHARHTRRRRHATTTPPRIVNMFGMPKQTARRRNNVGACFRHTGAAC